MRANKGTASALDTQVGFPNRNFEGDVALFPLGCAGGIGAIIREFAHRDLVAVAGNHLAENFLDKHRGILRNRLAAIVSGGNLLRVVDFVHIGNCLVDGFEVLLNNFFALAAVSILNGFLDGGNRFVSRQNIADREETGLHNCVDAVAHTGGFSDFVCVNDVKLDIFGNHIPLHLDRQGIPNFFG